MNIVTTIKEWQDIRKKLSDQQIGFVPTMGNLHAGHMSLYERARKENDLTVASIFLNPTQFNQSRDFELYPRTIEQDIELLSSHQVDFLFLPDSASMYPDQFQVQVTETELCQILEGEFRPGHFNGVLTVVLKLFNIIQPTRAYFGEKDYQQLLLVKKMVSALFLAIDVVACPTVRAEDKLPLSSRNSRLTKEQREKAAHFSKLLASPISVEAIIHQLKELGFKVDYVFDKWQRRLGAVWLDDVRLIDNIERL